MSTLALQLITHHRTETLGPLFASLAEQTDRDLTLYWIDSGSTPEEYAAMCRLADEARLPFPVLRRRSETNINFSAGHQSLYADHRADYVALINDDAILDPGYFAALRAALDADPTLGAVEGVVLRWNPGEHGAPVRTDTVDTLGLSRTPWQAVEDVGAGEPYDPAFFGGAATRDVFGVSGCLPMYRRAAVGPQLFEPSYVFYKEDVDVAYRLRRGGWRAATVAAARAHHMRSLKRGTTRGPGVYRRLFYSYRNHLWNLRRNLSFTDWLRYGWCIIPYEAAKAAYLLVTHPTILWRTITGNPA